jgi:hypothetical protein
MVNQLIIAVIAILILLFYFKSIVKVALFIVVAFILYVLAKNEIGFSVDWSLTDIFNKGQEIKEVAENEWNKLKTQELEVKEPLVNVCYQGQQMLAKGTPVYWKEGMPLEMIPFKACYQGCEYKIGDELSGDFFNDDEGRVGRQGNWTSTGQSCCPIGKRWVESQQMCCEPNTVCLRITGNQQTN